MTLSRLAGPARATLIAFGAVLAVAGGPAAASALAAGPGPVYAWGGNFDGEVDSSGTGIVDAPVPGPVSRSVVAVSEGGQSSFVLTADGQVLGWGDNAFGDLGTGSSDTVVPTPQRVAGLPPVSALASGADHTLALLDDGTVRAWGYDYDGELGDGQQNTQVGTPVVVQAVGGGGELQSVVAVAAGFDQSLALRSDGSVVGWGYNYNGQVGDGTNNSDSTPVPVKGLGGAGTLGSVRAIAAGQSHSLALLGDGTVVDWGANANGELGDDSTQPSEVPVRVAGVGGTGTLSDVVAIAGSTNVSAALRADGSVVDWGDNTYGQLGRGTTGGSSDAPVLVSGLAHVVAIAADGYATYALEANGTVWAWGSDSRGELADAGAAASTACKCSATPVEVGSGFSSPAALGSGASADHELAIIGPQVAVSPGSLSFGTQPQSTLGAPRAVTVTNTGRAALIVSGLSFAGADSGDFVASRSTCGGSVAPGSSCTVQVSFAPQGSGARSATLQIASNDIASPATVTLAGTGGVLPAGSAGRAGPAGPAGLPGATGAQGPAGQLELVTCTPHTVTQGKHKTTVMRCSARLISAALELSAVSTPLAQIVRGHVVYATGTVVPGARGTTRLELSPRRTLRPGRYTLTERVRRDGRIVTRRTSIDLAR